MKEDGLKIVKGSIVALLALFLLFERESARADFAPPVNPPGGNISPEGSTEVQMVAEKVLIDFSQSLDNTAQVTAWFRFRNTGNANEHLKVRFPLNGNIDGEFKSIDGRGPTPEVPQVSLIKDFTVLNGDVEIPTETIRDDDPNAIDFFMPGVDVIYWAEFETDFPVGRDVELTAKYTYEPTVRANNLEINYIIATAAGWKGPIGTGKVAVRFPYPLNDLNVLSDYQFTAERYSHKGILLVIQQNEIRLEWGDLEPERNDNLSIRVVPIDYWQDVLHSQVQVNQTPQDAKAWEALAHAYAAAGEGKNISFIDERWADLYIFACENSLVLNPNNAGLHQDFAERIYYANWRGRDPYYNKLALREIAATLRIDPANEVAQRLLSYIRAEGIYAGDDVPTVGAPFPTPGEPTYTIRSDLLPSSTETYTRVIPFAQVHDSTPEYNHLSPFFSTVTSSKNPTIYPSRKTNWVWIITGVMLLAGGFVVSGWARAKKK